MAHSTFQLQIVTVTNALFEGAAEELHCTGTGGQMTVLAHHEPFMTSIEPCTLRVQADGKEHEFPISKGVLEVADNKAVVLCSSDERNIPA